MQGNIDPEVLNPRQYFDFLNQVINENKVIGCVFVRRVISSIFYALFNYWGAKRYKSGKKGSGPNGDSYRLDDFFKELSGKGLGYAIYEIFVHRVAADHYVLNPNRISIWVRPWKGLQDDVEISRDKLSELLVYAYEILDYLENK